MHRVIAFDPSLVSETGDHAAATVLSQIMYWHRGRLRVRRNGVYWLAKSRAEMCVETGVTLDQYKRIMPQLVRQGWVVTERHLFKGKITSFIRLTEKGMLAAGLEPTPTNPLVAHDTNPLGVYDTNLYSTESTAKSTAGTGELTFAGTGKTSTQDDGGKGNKGSTVQQELKVQGFIEVPGMPVEGLMKATEILKQHTAPLKGGLGGYWQSRMSTVYGNGGFQKKLTSKELGQLKTLSKSLGEHTRPVIDYAINHWWKFASRAGAISGTSFPAEPQIGFLLKHHAVAMNLLHPPHVQSPPQPVASPVQSIAPSAESEPVHTLTSQELTEMLEGLKTP